MSELDHTEILEELEAITNWEIDEWEFKDGNDQPQSLTVELERREEYDIVVTADDIRGGTNPKAITRDIEDEYEEGAPIDLVIQAITDEFECSDDKAQKMIEKLRRKGEVYEPTKGVLRTT